MSNDPVQKAEKAVESARGFMTREEAAAKAAEQKAIDRIQHTESWVARNPGKTLVIAVSVGIAIVIASIWL